jgi:hypothetical protein
MIVATVVAVILVFFVDDEAIKTSYLDGFTVKLLIAVACTTFTWLLTTYLTKPTKMDTLLSFYKLARPGGPGWKKVRIHAEKNGIDIGIITGQSWEMPLQILCVFIGCVVIYSSLFSIGSFVYGQPWQGSILAVLALIGTYFLFRLFDKLRIANH